MERSASRFGELQKSGPLFVRAAGQGYPAVFAGAGVDAVGSGPRVPVAHAALLTAVDGVVQQEGCNEVQGRLKLRQVQVDALAGAAAAVEGRKDGSHGELGDDEVGVGAIGVHGGAVGPAGDIGEAYQG